MEHRALTAALAVSVLPISALAASRIRGDAETRAVAGCLLVAGRGRLPRAPSGRVRLVDGRAAGPRRGGMGMALPALSGELMPERTRHDVSRLLSIRHAGIAIALAALRP